MPIKPPTKNKRIKNKRIKINKEIKNQPQQKQDELTRQFDEIKKRRSANAGA